MPPSICILSTDPNQPACTALARPQVEILSRALAQVGITPHYHDWSATALPAGHDLVLPLLAWGYHSAPALWLERIDQWEAAGIPLANPASILRWNHDKGYLAQLAERGAPVVPSLLTDAASPDDLAEARNRFGDIEIVVKPTISAGADGVIRIQPGAALPPSVLGRRVLFQPMLPDIFSEGEYSLFWFAGRYSHAVLKKPRAGDFRVQIQHGGTDRLTTAPETAMAAAQAVLAMVEEPLLYARVDLIADGRGGHALIELELIEPQLFLDHAPDQGRLFAETVMAAASRS